MIAAPPVQRLLLGNALRRYRENLGYVLEDAARVLECDRSKISRIETGKRGIRPKELRELLAEYGVGEQERSALAAIAQTGLRGSRYLPYADAIPAPYQEYLVLEQAASHILTYAPQHMPDLLQTPAYAQASATADPADITRGNLAGLTLARQQTLGERRRPKLTALISESALHQAAGDTDVVQGQLRALTHVSEQVVVQVLPIGRRTPPSGPATILRFAGLPGLGAVYLPALSGGVCLVGEQDVASYTKAFERLRKAALSPAASAKLIGEIARQPNGAGA